MLTLRTKHRVEEGVSLQQENTLCREIQLLCKDPIEDYMHGCQYRTIFLSLERRYCLLILVHVKDTHIALLHLFVINKIATDGLNKLTHLFLSDPLDVTRDENLLSRHQL